MTIALFSLAALLAGAAEPPAPRLPFAPRTYLCQRAERPPVLDGKLDDPVWVKAAWTEDFQDIEGSLRPRPRFRTRAKMAWDDTCFYVAAELEDPHVWATLRERDSVIFQDNDFEIFIDPDGTTSPYYEFEMNALNTVWDLLLRLPYRDGERVAVSAWDMKGLRTAVHVEGTLNDPWDRDRGWTVEVAIPWKTLTEVSGRGGAPKAGDQWRVNFSRVQWRTHAVGGRTIKDVDGSGRPLPEDNWVWSPQGVIDMHYPERWGVVQFSASPAGAPPEPVRLRPEEVAKEALRQVYYAQRAFQARHGRFAGSLSELGLEPPVAEGYGPVVLEGGRLTWAAEMVGRKGGPTVQINAQGTTTVKAVRP